MVEAVSPRRGEIYYVDFEPVVGSEQGKTRPALVIQNDVGNQYSSTTIVCVVSSVRREKKYPFHVWLPDGLLSKPSVVMCEQIRTVSLARFKSGRLAVCGPDILQEVDRALRHSLQL